MLITCGSCRAAVSALSGLCSVCNTYNPTVCPSCRTGHFSETHCTVCPSSNVLLPIQGFQALFNPSNRKGAFSRKVPKLALFSSSLFISLFLGLFLLPFISDVRYSSSSYTTDPDVSVLSFDEAVSLPFFYALPSDAAASPSQTVVLEAREGYSFDPSPVFQVSVANAQVFCAVFPYPQNFDSFQVSRSPAQDAFCSSSYDVTSQILFSESLQNVALFCSSNNSEPVFSSSDTTCSSSFFPSTFEAGFVTLQNPGSSDPFLCQNVNSDVFYCYDFVWNSFDLALPSTPSLFCTEVSNTSSLSCRDF